MWQLKKVEKVRSQNSFRKEIKREEKNKTKRKKKSRFLLHPYVEPENYRHTRMKLIFKTFSLSVCRPS